VTTGRRIANAAWLLLPVIALVYLGLGVHQAARVPGEDDWDEAARIVRAGWRDGDLVVFSPAWAHAGAPRFQGLAVDAAEAWDPYAMSKASRVWVVASPPARDPTPPEGFAALARTDAGRMAVHLWTPPASPRPKYDFLANLKDAKVARVRDGGERQACTLFTQGQWHCGTTHPWMYVGPHERDIDGRVRRVIYAHAVDPGQTLEVSWPELPSARRLTLHFGQTLRGVERDAGAPVHLSVRFGERTVLERTLAIDDPRWQREDFDLEGLEGGLTLAISTASNSWRQFCFTADLWE
jgi:hypothetical protein